MVEIVCVEAAADVLDSMHVANGAAAVFKSTPP
jgi:hypothetical protein